MSTHADASAETLDEAPPTTEVTPDAMPLLPASAQRVQARALYWQGWRVTEIARLFGLPKQTVQSWKSRDGWDDARPIDRVAAQIEVRMVQLLNKHQKSGGDFKEIDLLGRQLERLARVQELLGAIAGQDIPTEARALTDEAARQIQRIQQEEEDAHGL